MSELPNTWVATNLGSVIEYGRTTKAEPSEINGNTWVLELEDIEKDTSRLNARLTFSARQSKSTKNCFNAGDVLYGKLRPYLNKVIVADRPGVCTTEIVPLNGEPYLNNRYIFYWLKHPAFLAYVEAASHGVNMPRLGTDKGKAAPFILAPLPEQKRIADKLDSTLTRVEACRDRLDRIPALLKRFCQSILAAATSGRLTEDWRKTPSTEVWSYFTVKEICRSVSDGDHQAPPQAETGIPFITISAFNDGKLRLEKASRFVPEAYFESLNTIRKPALGDILYSVTGSIGIPALVDTDTPFTFQRHVAILKPDITKVLSEYLLCILGSDQIRRQALEIATGTAQLTIPLNGLRGLTTQLPPLEEQHEIVRRVETLFAFADRLEARLATARKQVDQLTPALLAKAFRGELVPQDPNDEPASELLKRLAATRSDAPKAKRGKKQQAAETKVA